MTFRGKAITRSGRRVEFPEAPERHLPWSREPTQDADGAGRVFVWVFRPFVRTQMLSPAGESAP